MQLLNFKPGSFRFKIKENKRHIFDPVRKKFVFLSPEEWVRQHCIQFLINEKNAPTIRMAVEKSLDLNGTKKRFDVVVYNLDGTVKLLVECKSPTVNITQAVFDQIARYNLSLKADLLMLTNGMNHYFCRMNYDQKTYQFLESLPQFDNL